MAVEMVVVVVTVLVLGAVADVLLLVMLASCCSCCCWFGESLMVQLSVLPLPLITFLAASESLVVPMTVACFASVCPLTSRAPVVTVLAQEHWKLSLGQIIVSWRCFAAIKHGVRTCMPGR